MEASLEHVYMQIQLENFRKLFAQADTTELVLAAIWQVLCSFRNHAIYLCHREFTPWKNGSVVSSVVW